MKPLIGITGREFKYGSIGGVPGILADMVVNAVLADYVDAVIASGGLPVHVPLRVDPADAIERLDGLLLSGGSDVAPARYGAAPDPDIGSVEPERDEFELEIARLAIGSALPTLGVCRGNQVLNVAAGGTLHQHRPAHERLDVPANTEIHAIDIVSGSIVSELYGTRHTVNSLHHQAIDRLGAGVTVVAKADDGDIEAIEFSGKPIVGIQWHPEMFRRREPIFDWLVEAAG